MGTKVRLTFDDQGASSMLTHGPLTRLSPREVKELRNALDRLEPYEMKFAEDAE